MMVGPRSSRPPASLSQRLRARDPETIADFYDRRAGTVREYCLLVCEARSVADATLASFIDFLGRLDEVGDDADVDELLWKATRSAAAGRAEVRVESRQVPSPHRFRRTAPVATAPGRICRAMPELLAAYANGELVRREPVDEHLADCAMCRTTVTRFRRAEGAFTREPSGQPDAKVREAWLELTARRAPRAKAGGSNEDG